MLATEPVVVQVMFCEVPTVQISPPLGAVKAKPPRMAKLASETSSTVASAASEILTLQVVETESGMVQE